MEHFVRFISIILICCILSVNLLSIDPFSPFFFNLSKTAVAAVESLKSSNPSSPVPIVQLSFSSLKTTKVILQRTKWPLHELLNVMKTRAFNEHITKLFTQGLFEGNRISRWRNFKTLFSQR